MRRDYSYLTRYIPNSPGRINMSMLAAQVGCEARVLRQHILIARINGEMIASDSEGYYMPVTDEEVALYYRTARKRAITTLRSLKRTRQRLIAAGYDISMIEGRTKDADTD